MALDIFIRAKKEAGDARPNKPIVMLLLLLHHHLSRIPRSNLTHSATYVV